MDSNMEKARPFNVLFLCRDNSARSIMAEVILNEIGQGRFCAFSAGTHPKGEIDPYAVAALRKAGFATEGLRSKSFEEFTDIESPELDFVFTLCDEAARDTCPHWPGAPMTADWALPDPVAVHGDEVMKHLAYGDAFRMLHQRIAAFAALPVKSLDDLSLQHRLDRIGTAAPRSTAA